MTANDCHSRNVRVPDLEPLHFWIDSHGQSWAVMGSPGQSREELLLEPSHFWSDSHGQSWAVTGSHGQSREDLSVEPLYFWSDSHGKSWAVMGSHGQPWAFFFLFSIVCIQVSLSEIPPPAVAAPASGRPNGPPMTTCAALRLAHQPAPLSPFLAVALHLNF